MLLRWLMVSAVVLLAAFLASSPGSAGAQIGWVLASLAVIALVLLGRGGLVHDDRAARERSPVRERRR
jgi:hypothetical protein